MSEDQIREAAWTVQEVTGSSGYMHAVDYDLEKFRRELDRLSEHIKAESKKAAN